IECGRPRSLPSVFDRNILSFNPSVVPKPIGECLTLPGVCCRGARRQIANPVHLPRLLRLRGEGLESEAERENDREPDPPHAHLGWDGWRESNRPLDSRVPPLLSGIMGGTVVAALAHQHEAHLRVL